MDCRGPPRLVPGAGRLDCHGGGGVSAAGGRLPDVGIRFLHLADTHLGARHASGSTAPFAENLRHALAPAARGEVDVVLHAGDLFDRSRPPPRWLAEGASALLSAADAGAEVVLLPGNHERSLLPATLLLAHPRLHLLDRPRTVRLAVGGIDLAVAGFPFVREGVRDRFESLLHAAGWPGSRAEVNVLLLHQALDGARVGTAGYVFRPGPDVVPRTFVPPGIDYAALGHVHRHQCLRHPRAPEVPLVFAGSTERTSRAERCEEKGFVTGRLVPGRTADWRFIPLPATPLPERPRGPRGSPWPTPTGS